MGSDAFGAEEAREKHRWGENRRVYTRKIRRPGENETSVAAATNQHTSTAVVTLPTTNDNQNDAPQEIHPTKDTDGAVTTAIDGGGTIDPPLDSQSQQLTPPRTEMVGDYLTNINNIPHLNSKSSAANDANSPTTEELVNVQLRDSQSSPAKGANAHQVNSPRTKDDDMNRQEEEPENALQSSPDKNTNLQARKPTTDYSLNRQEGELQNALLPDSQSSPADVAMTEMQQLDSPRADVICDDTLNLNRQEEELQNITLSNSQSSPVKDVNSQSEQLDSSMAEVVYDDSSSLNRQKEEEEITTVPNSQSSPVKNADSQPHQQDLLIAEVVRDGTPSLNRQEEEVVNVALSSSQSSPNKNVDSHPQQLHLPITEVACDDTSNLNRQEGELLNATLPITQPSPLKDINYQPVRVNLPMTEIRDDAPSLKMQEGEESSNVTLPTSESSPVKDVNSHPVELNLTTTDTVCDDTLNLNSQEGEELPNVTLPNSRSPPVKDVNPEPVESNLTKTEAVHDDTPDLNRQEGEELPNATLPDSQTSPLMEVNSQSVFILPTTEVAHDGATSLNRQEGEHPNVRLPNSQSSPVKDVDAHPVELNVTMAEAVRDDTPDLNRQEGEEFPDTTLPDSHTSPLIEVNSQSVQLILPTTEVAHDDTTSLNRQEEEEHPNVTPSNSQSLPVKDVNSHPVELNVAMTEAVRDDTLPDSQTSPLIEVNSQSVQLILPTTEVARDDTTSLNRQEEEEHPNVTPSNSQSLPVKDVNSHPVELNVAMTEAVRDDTLPDSQTSPLIEVNSQSVQLILPTTEVAHDNTTSLNRQEEEELPNVTLPNSQSSPMKDVNSHPVELNLTTTEAVCDDAPDLNMQEGEEHPNVTLPDSQTSPLMEVNSQPGQLNLPTVEAARDDKSSLNRQEGEIPNGDDVASVKSVVTRVGDKVNIRLSSSIPKQEARALKRKLVSDLDQVRSLAKRLDTKEFQLFNGGLTNSAEIGTGGGIPGGIAQSLSQFSTSAAMGQGVGLKDSRPFRRLSVSVMDINRRGGSEIFEKEKRTPKANQFYQSSDFISGKERLPAESNKKQKSSGGRKKQSGGGSDFDKQIFKKCGTLLQQLMKHKFGWVFNTPVDVKGLCLHDYYDVIKHPMDLGTVKNRLSKNWYKSPMEFAEDVRLTFSNAMTYNPEGQDVHVMALELANIFEQKWVDVQAEYSRKLRYEGLYDIGLPTPQSRLTPLPFYGSPPPINPSVPRPVYQEMKHLDRSESFSVPVDPRPTPVYSAPAVRTPAPKKPKAKDLNKRDMTYEEKQKLSTHLQDLPSEKLDSIVQIIKKRNPSLCQHDEEIEVDIDSVDAETLWELDRFVINYKKTLSKHKRKAEIALQKAQAQKSIHTERDTLGTKDPNETRPGGVPSPAREGKQTDNVSYSTSSSSSSSDSGSSSSDSDSDSSSGSDGGQ